MMSTLEVSVLRLHGNVRAIERAVAEAAGSALGGVASPALLGVVKANGYGHGAALCAPVLAEAGVRWLGVTDAEEGAAVRESLGGRDAEILMMSGPPGDVDGAGRSAEAAVRHGLTPVVWTVEQLGPLAAATGLGDVLSIHLEIDTGMSRQGIGCGKDLSEFLGVLAGLPKMRLGGVLTHLASAEDASGTQTRRQMDVFEAALREVTAAGFKPRWVHVGNASTIDNGSVDVVGHLCRLAEEAGAQAMVRCGLGLYGLCAPLEGAAGLSRLRPRLEAVMTWRTVVVAVQEVTAGASIGYGASFTVRQAMRTALLPVGYADGLRRGMSGTDRQAGGWVMIGGYRAAIVGRVSMNLTTVDVTGVEPPVRTGDVVTLLGDGVTAEDHARLCEALPYEILCGLRGRAVAG